IDAWRAQPAVVELRVAIVRDDRDRLAHVLDWRPLEVIKHRRDVLLPRGVVEDTHAHGETAAELRRGDEPDVPARERTHELRVHPLDAVLVGRPAHAPPETEHRERCRAEDL